MKIILPEELVPYVCMKDGKAEKKCDMPKELETVFKQYQRNVYFAEKNEKIRLRCLTKETRDSRDFIATYVLSYGVEIGYFYFKDNLIYAISDIKHISVSDCMMYWKLSKEEYEKLAKFCKPVEELDSYQELDREIYEKYYQNDFLIGESIYCKRNSFTLDDVREFRI